MRRDAPIGMPAPPASPGEFMERLLHRHTSAGLAVAMILLADTVLVGREWVQLSLADLQARTGLARRTVQRQLDALEADRLLRRDHREGRPNANASRADRYALNIDALASRPEEEAAPTRGPTKEKPDEASPSPGTIVDSPLSDKSGESSGTDQL